MKSILFFLLLLCSNKMISQSLAINTDGSTANASALLDVKSTNKGMLVPRMTAVQRIAIATPANGLIVYDTDSLAFSYFNGTIWTFFKGTNNLNGNWGLKGNAGTTAANFIGTTDAQDFRIKVNNQPFGFLGSANKNIFLGENAGIAATVGGNNIAIGSAALSKNIFQSESVAIGDSSLFNNGQNVGAGFVWATYNTAIGAKALFTNDSGFFNTAVGHSALYANKTGYYNTALGNDALFNNKTGNFNTAIGAVAMLSNTTGESNTAIGSGALVSNTTGFKNTAVGSNAMLNNTTGFYNVAIGESSMYNTKTGNNNTVVGFAALSNGTSGNDNVALGRSALRNNTSGNQNIAVGRSALFNSLDRSGLVAIGDSALYNNSIGATTAFHSTGNTAIGSKTLFSNTTGSSNTATGISALGKNTIGSFNTATGDGALFNNVGGVSNTAFGSAALLTNTNGFSNTAIGTLADVTLNNLSNATAIGANAKVSTSNTLVLGGVSGDAVNVAIGATTTNPYGHGGINRILEIKNDAFPITANMQSHLILSTEGSAGSMGGVTWAGTAITAPEKRTGFIGNVYEAASTNALPSASLTFYTTNAGSLSEKVRINNAGNVGIGTTTPNAPLQFPNDILNRKIVLWESGNNNNQYYGLGINGGTLRYQVDDVAANHVFFAGVNASTSNQLMSIKGNGTVQINAMAGTDDRPVTVDNTGTLKADNAIKYICINNIAFKDDGPSVTSNFFPSDANLAASFATGTTATRQMSAPIIVPDGATIVSITGYAFDNSATEDVRFTIYRLPPTLSGVQAIANSTVTTTGNSAGIQAVTNVLINEGPVNNQTLGSYMVRVTIINNTTWDVLNTRVKAFVVGYRFN
jgi:hypothetical protein